MKKEKKWTEKMHRTFAKVGGFLSNTLFPTDFKCAFCDNDVPDFDNNPFCDDCLKDITFNDGNQCMICGEPIDNEAKVCDFCQKNMRKFKRAICPFVYSGKVRSAILRFKDDGKKYLAKVFARFIADAIKKSEIKITKITFVPLTDKKKRKRGFDQAELLAKELALLLNLKVDKLFVKVKDGKTQKFSNFKERHENMIGMYAMTDVKLDKSDFVLIVDDIITTGATIDFCAGLCANKVNTVYAAAVARNKLKEKANIK